MAELNDRVAIVYGAGSPRGEISNGLAAAATFAKAGATVYAVDRAEEALAQTVEEIAKLGGVCHTLIADVSDVAAVEQATAAVLEREGRIDIVHNNVGISEHSNVLETDRDSFARILDVNLLGAFNTIRAALPSMIERGRGSIINISSIGSMVAFPRMVTYQVSKAALESLTMSVALDFAAKGIRCNSIVAGFIDTPMVRRKAIERFGSQEAMTAALSGMSPTGAMGTPWDLGEAAAFLASDAANYINGVNLIVDGGAVWR